MNERYFMTRVLYLYLFSIIYSLWNALHEDLQTYAIQKTQFFISFFDILHSFTFRSISAFRIKRETIYVRIVALYVAFTIF